MLHKFSQFNFAVLISVAFRKELINNLVPVLLVDSFLGQEIIHFFIGYPAISILVDFVELLLETQLLSRVVLYLR